MPSIVDIVHGDTGSPTKSRRWRLSRVGGPSLDESMTLNENNVRDGELLFLTSKHPPAPEWVALDPCDAVAVLADTAGAQAVRIIGIASCLYAASCGATALVWSGIVNHTAGHVVTAAAIAASAAVGAVVTQRAHAEAMPSVALSVTAVAFTMAAGFLAVPAGVLAANFLLAAAAGLAMSIVLLRITGCGTAVLTAVATFAAMAAVAAGSEIWMPARTIGVAVSTLSLAGLGAAARMSIALAGLAPTTPGSGDRGDDESDLIDVGDARAVLGHQVLTGLVIGLSCSATLGTVLVAAGGLHDGTFWPGLAAFTAVVGLALLMRTATYADVHRAIALGSAGMISATAALAVVVVSAAEHAIWVSVLATAVGAASLGSVFGATVNPLGRRAIERLEYVALAAVVPLACWVGDLYGLVRGMSLT
jgi:ESX secretion system protein EccD